MATVLVTSDDLGTPQNKQTASRSQQNPTNYMTFQTLQEMKYRHPHPHPAPLPKEEVMYLPQANNEVNTLKAEKEIKYKGTAGIP